MELTEKLTYCPLTGIVVNQQGNEAGWLSNDGYRVVRVKGKVTRLSRLIFETFIEPLGELCVDHINRVRTDNRLENLRAATRQQNAHNRLSKGVDQRPNGRWRARIKIDGRHIALGTYSTEEEAEAVYQEARDKHFGEFNA